jgi:uncharacterized protein
MLHSNNNVVMTRNLVGGIPEPAELYGRKAVIADIWRLLEGNNILLLAPRRFGKSGIMRHLLLHPRPGFLPMSFELEDVDSPEEFVWRVTRELLIQSPTRAVLSGAKRLPAAITQWLAGTFDEAEFEGAKVKFKAAIRDDWRESARRLLTELEKTDKTFVFLFDELPAMLDRIIAKEGADAARDFLAWFRTVRLAQKDVLRRHRFVVAGSVGIDQVLRKLEATDRLVDFARVAVEPLDSVSADRLVADLAAGCGLNWSPALSARLLTLIGAPVPYFIHIFLSQLGQLPRSSRDALATSELDRIYSERVLGPTCRNYFTHYRTRLLRYGKMRENAALAVLRSLGGGRVSRPVLYETYRRAHGRGANPQGFDDVMADLECDWYVRLDPDTNEFYFRLKVMNDWWTRWYPAGKIRRTSRKPARS